MKRIIEIGLWLFLTIGFVAGFSYGDGFFGSLTAGIITVIVTGVFSAVIFGVFIILNDIRSMLEKALDALGTSTDRM